jgi:hypothetical protein
VDCKHQDVKKENFELSVKNLNAGEELTHSSPEGAAFDGANVWVVNAGSNTVSKH